MEEKNKEYLVIATFTSDMEKVQFVDIFKTTSWVCKTKEQAERVLTRNRTRAIKRKITCGFKIMSREI